MKGSYQVVKGSYFLNSNNPDTPDRRNGDKVVSQGQYKYEDTQDT